jgi:hypothetical protein
MDLKKSDRGKTYKSHFLTEQKNRLVLTGGLIILLTCIFIQLLLQIQLQFRCRYQNQSLL